MAETKVTGRQIDGDWQDYTPTDVNITVGNGTQTAKYTRVGDTIHFRWILVCGSTSSITSNARYGIPVDAHADYDDAYSAIGVAVARDDGSNTYAGVAYFEQATIDVEVGWDDGTGNTSASFPFTETAGDQICVTGTYEAA